MAVAHPSVQTVLVFDVELRRPACALVPAAMGGNPNLAHHLPTEQRLLAPTSGMRAFVGVTDKQVAQLAGGLAADNDDGCPP